MSIKQNANGGNRQLLNQFFAPENNAGDLPGFQPTANLLQSALLETEYIQVEYVEKGVTQLGTFIALENGSFVANFDGENQLSFAFADEAPAADLLQGNDAEFIDLSGVAGAATINFTVNREATFDNLIGFYEVGANGAVTDANGNILLPGDEGYTAAAFANKLEDVTLTGTNETSTSFTATFAEGVQLGMYVMIDGAADNIAVSYGAANGGLDRFKKFGDNTFGIEDQVGLGDQDFNDFVVTYELA